MESKVIALTNVTLPLGGRDNMAQSGRRINVGIRVAEASSILSRTSGFIAEAGRTRLRISFSLTTNREEVRRRYEPYCAPLADRLETIRQLRGAGLDVYATLAPVLPCEPEVLAELALEATARDIIADPLHSSTNRPRGAVTRDAACRISEHAGFAEWHQSSFQADVIARIRQTVERAGRRPGVGPAGFGWLAQVDETTQSAIQGRRNRVR